MIEIGRTKCSSQLRDQPLQGVADSRWWILPPQRIGELIGRNDSSDMQRQQRQEHALLRPRHHDLASLVVEDVEPSEQPDVHPPTVPPTGECSGGLHEPSGVSRAELVETAQHDLRRAAALDRVGETAEDVIVAPEGRKVFEREVDGPSQRTAVAQVAELVDLSLSSGHSGAQVRRNGGY